MSKYIFQNTQRPEYSQPEGFYVLKCVGFEKGIWPSGESRGDPKIEIKLLIEGTGTTFKHTLSPTNDPKRQFARWQIDQMLLAFELVGPNALGEEIDLENEEWLKACVVGQRAWAHVTCKTVKKNPSDPNEKGVIYNNVGHWLLGKEARQLPPDKANEQAQAPTQTPPF